MSATVKATNAAPTPIEERAWMTNAHSGAGPPALGATTRASAVVPAKAAKTLAVERSGRRSSTAAPRSAKDAPTSHSENLIGPWLIGVTVASTLKTSPAGVTSSALLTGARGRSASPSSVAGRSSTDRTAIPGLAPSSQETLAGMTQVTQGPASHRPILMDS